MFNGKPILLVEDNDDDVFITQTAFRRAGVPGALNVVRNGEEAISYLSGNAPHTDRDRFPLPGIILLDLNMPRVNGFEFLRWLRGQETLKRIVVEILTASNRPGDVERAFDAGANGYFVKPSRIEDLTDMLRLWHQLMKFRALPTTL